MSNARNAKKSSNSPSEPPVPKDDKISGAKPAGDYASPCKRCKDFPGGSCTKCNPPAPSPCVMCDAPLTYFKLEKSSKPLTHVQTTCGHCICNKCIHAFKARQYSEHEKSRKIPAHKCHICGALNMRISPKGESPEKPHTFYAADQVDVFGRVGICHEFPPSLLHAAEEIQRLDLTIPEILSIVLFVARGFPAKARIPVSLEKYRALTDILDQVDLVSSEDAA